MNHRVYAQYDDDLWVGVSWLAERTTLTTRMQYVTLTVVDSEPVCLTLPDGRTLCDFGPEHDHD